MPNKSVQRQMLKMLEQQQKAICEMTDVLLALGFDPGDLAFMIGSLGECAEA